MNSAATTSLGKVKPISKVKKKTKAKVAAKVQPKTLYLKISIILIFIGLLGLGTWRIMEAYKGRIFPKVTVAGIKIGGKTPAEAKYILQNYVNKQNENGPEITYADQTVKPKLEEIGATFNVDKTVTNAYNYGRKGSVTEKVKDNAQMLVKPYNVTLSPEINEQKLDEYLSQIAQVVEVAPENANLVISGGNISLVPAKTGRGLDKDKLKSDLNNLVNSKQFNGKITLVTSDLPPKILDEATSEAKIEAEKYMLAAPINITFENQTFVADKGSVGSWIVFSENGNKLDADVSTAKIGDYAGWIASQIEIPMVNKEIMEGTGEVINEGQDGRGVDTGRLTSELQARVISATTGSAISVGTFPILKGEVTKNPHAQPGRYPGRYVDINLSEQTLYAFEGNKLVNQFLVSTGLTGPTPTGEFSVYAKDRSTLMDGPGYYLPNVEWVSWFSGDYSIHGTYWHNNFGNPMSHGCVNASNGDAEWLFGWDEVGTPVYIHW